MDERIVSFIAFYLVAIVVFSTLIIMVLMRPRNHVEWATTGKEVAFAAIVARSLYTILTGHILPQPHAVIFWVGCAILLFHYLVVVYWQWASPYFWRGIRCCRDKPWIIFWAIIISEIVLTLLLQHFGGWYERVWR